jgi:hypothetical protein
MSSAFYNFPEHIFGSASIIRTFINFEKGSSPISPKEWGLTVYVRGYIGLCIV